MSMTERCLYYAPKQPMMFDTGSERVRIMLVILWDNGDVGVVDDSAREHSTHWRIEHVIFADSYEPVPTKEAQDMVLSARGQKSAEEFRQHYIAANEELHKRCEAINAFMAKHNIPEKEGVELTCLEGIFARFEELQTWLANTQHNHSLTQAIWNLDYQCMSEFVAKHKIPTRIEQNLLVTILKWAEERIVSHD